jgi:hypothetical protein
MLGKVAHAGVHLDAVDLAMTNVHSTKGTDLAGSMNETGLSTVLVNGAAVGASKKEKATIASKVNIWALPKIAAGKEALVAVANFYQAQPVTMSLTSKCVLGIEMTYFKDSVIALGSFASVGDVSVPIPANTTPCTYSLRATQNGLFWCSQPVDIVAAV